MADSPRPPFDSNSQGSRAYDIGSSQYHRPLEYATEASESGLLIKVIEKREIEAQTRAQDEAKISDVQCISSFNWMDRSNPSILVPGSPPRWTPPVSPRRLKEDSGDYLRDQNAARSPKFPIEPALRAILTENPAFDCAADFFGCGSTLGSLLRFVRGIAKPFRFQVDVIGNTVFLVRKERSPGELIKDVRGFGHTFAEEYTTWNADVAASESHQRILSYSFAGMRMLVRFEGDGYLPDKMAGSAKADTSAHEQQGELNLEANLADLMKQKVPVLGKDLKIVHQGSRVAQGAIFDLKTRSLKKIDQDILAEELPRFWVKQVPNFVLAFHRNGLFTDIRVQNITAKIQEWENVNQVSLRQLAALLEMIRTTARNAGGAKIEVSLRDLNSLEIYRVSDQSWSALPPALQVRWEGLDE